MKGVRSLIIIFFVVISSVSYSDELRVTVERSIELGKIALSGKKRMEVIKPRDGFILKVRGRVDGIVKLEVDDIRDLGGFKVVEMIPEAEWLKLDARGEGIFKVGAKIVIPGFIPPGRYRSEIRARVTYKGSI